MIVSSLKLRPPFPRTSLQRIGSRGFSTKPGSVPTPKSWKILKISGLVGALGATLLTIVQLQKEVLISGNDLLKKMTFSLVNSRIKFAENVGASSYYVPRPFLEKKILDV